VELTGITGSNPYSGEWVAETDGFVTVSESNANSTWRVYAGATAADTVLCRGPCRSWTIATESTRSETSWLWRVPARL
jgi:hypothetical protein